MSGEAQPGDDDPGEATPDDSGSSRSSSATSDTETRTVVGDHVEQSGRSQSFYQAQGERIASVLSDNSNAESEAASKYDGIFSWAGERKAFGIGFAAGYMAAEFGTWGLTTALVGAVLGELGVQTAKGRSLKKHGVTEKTRDAIRNEPWYALTGLLVGILFVRGHHPGQILEELGMAFGAAFLALPL